MKKAIVMFVALLTVFTGGAALAHVSQVDAFAGIIDDDPEFERVNVFGTITCTAGETFAFRINVITEDGDRAVGRAQDTCTGDEQFWVARARVLEGSFTEEFAAYRIRGRTSDDSTFADSGLIEIFFCEGVCG